MPIYSPPVKDTLFILHDVLDLSSTPVPGYDELDRAFTAAILEEAGKLSSEVLAPLNRVGDEQGCTLENGVVRTPEGFRDAYRKICEGGWISLDCDPDYGGQGMPAVMNSAVGEYFVSANMAFNMYQGLSHGAYNAIHTHGTGQQKAAYLPNMVQGRWSGTMNLTEPQCGTDLGLIRTRAEPQDDGTFRITGQKIWISAGEHDLTDNIVHLVLARLPDGPTGVKGISLFIVPKFLVRDDGTPGARNAVSCGGLERKMGIHGNATCVMNYDGATGYLLGEANKGMRAMFTMMNEARLGVGMQGLGQASVAYQNALAFARERLQGRDVTGPVNPGGPADPIIVHPDVRRNLLDQKSFVEGGRAFALWAATLLDRARRNADADADAMISLLTPVIKGFLTDKGFETTVLAQQTLGGSGFTTEWGLEQFVRDARITMVYEGTNGIQALDLVGRKLGQNGGRTMMAFFDEVQSALTEAGAGNALPEGFADPLRAATRDLREATMFFMQNGVNNPDDALSGSYDYMHLFGHVCLGYMWVRMARAAQAALDAGSGDAEFLRAKIATGRYYMARQLPATAMHRKRIESGAEPVMSLDAANF